MGVGSIAAGINGCTVCITSGLRSVFLSCRNILIFMLNRNGMHYRHIFISEYRVLCQCNFTCCRLSNAGFELICYSFVRKYCSGYGKLFTAINRSSRSGYRFNSTICEIIFMIYPTSHFFHFISNSDGRRGSGHGVFAISKSKATGYLGFYITIMEVFEIKLFAVNINDIALVYSDCTVCRSSRRTFATDKDIIDGQACLNLGIADINICGSVADSSCRRADKLTVIIVVIRLIRIHVNFTCIDCCTDKSIGHIIVIAQKRAVVRKIIVSYHNIAFCMAVQHLNDLCAADIFGRHRRSLDGSLIIVVANISRNIISVLADVDGRSVKRSIYHIGKERILPDFYFAGCCLIEIFHFNIALFRSNFILEINLFSRMRYSQRNLLGRLAHQLIGRCLVLCSDSMCLT